MSDSFIPLLQFFATVGEVVGRKKCQKLVHILQECGHDLGFEFKLALYGAYSSTLQAHLEDFVTGHYLEEQPGVTEVAGYPTSKFVVSEHGKAVLEKLGCKEAPSWQRLAQELNSCSTRDLEATSTILFLTRRGIQGDDLRDKFKSLKPHLADIFEKGRKLAESLPISG